MTGCHRSGVTSQRSRRRTGRTSSSAAPNSELATWLGADRRELPASRHRRARPRSGDRVPRRVAMSVADVGGRWQCRLMEETTPELLALQQLLDTSFARASPHLTSIMTPARRLTAERLVADLPVPAVLNIATVTANGEPRISAVDGHFLRGHWYFTTESRSPKARQLDAR